MLADIFESMSTWRIMYSIFPLLLIIDREARALICLVVSVRLSADAEKTSHETQNQPNTLLKGSIINMCVSVISKATSIQGFCSLSRF